MELRARKLRRHHHAPVRKRGTGRLQGHDRAAERSLGPDGPRRRSGRDGGFFAGDLADVALYPLALARAHVTAHYADATDTPCTAITGAPGSTYTPVVADLGDTLSSTVTATGAAHSASSEGESEGPVDDGHGNLALASIEAWVKERQ